MAELVTASVPPQFAEMVEIDQFLATINEHAIITVTDSSGHLIYVNDAFCRLTQWDRSELIGQHYSLYSADYHSDTFYEDLWATLRAGSIWRGRVKNRAKDGSTFWIDSIVKPVLSRDGEISHIISVRSDITELVEAQEALEVIRQNEAAIRRILAISSASIPVERMLAGALEVLSLVPWLSQVWRSAIFLKAPDSDALALTASHSLEAEVAGDTCLGECICQHTLETRSLQFADLIASCLPASTRASIDDDAFAHILFMAFDGFAMNYKLVGRAKRMDRCIGTMCRLVLGANANATGPA